MAYVPRKYIAVLDDGKSDSKTDSKSSDKSKTTIKKTTDISERKVLKESWVKSVKPENKVVHLDSMTDFPTLMKETKNTESKVVGGAGEIKQIESKTLTFAQRLKKKLEDDKINEEKKRMQEELALKKAEREALEYSSIQARFLHKKMFREDCREHEDCDESNIMKDDESFEEE